MKGKIASNREIAARWSFAEITGRFANAYRQNHTDVVSVTLMAKIQGGALFDNLSPAEHYLLAQWFDTGYRRDYAYALNNWYRTFHCVSWTKSQLARVHTLPIIDPLEAGRSLAFLSYIAHPRKRLPNGQPDQRDPAVAADATPISMPFVQSEPLIVGHWSDGKLTLWEGNFRAVLFARTADPAAEVLVWIPLDGGPA